MSPDSSPPLPESLSDPFAHLSEGSQLSLSVEAKEQCGTMFNVQAKVIHAFRPFTMSPVVRISFLDGGSSIGATSSEAVLKSHDYRCLNNVRKTFNKGLPWSQSKEQDYREYLAESPHPAEYYDDTFFLLESECLPGGFEAYLERECQRSYKAEKETYERLKEEQLYNCVSMQREDGTRVDGLLFEYISSILLSDFIETWAARIPPLPIDLLKRICDTTVCNREASF